MKKRTLEIFENTFKDHPSLTVCKEQIEEAFEALVSCYKNGGMVLICGNGGSAADSEHIVGELMKGFLNKRPLPPEHKKAIKEAKLYENLQGTLPAISLVSQSSVITAYMNDVEPDMVFAQQVYGYRGEQNLLIGISTSGNAANVTNAIKVAKAFGMKTIGLTGQDGGILAKECDVTIKVPEKMTYKVQELHLPVYHTLCAMVESEFFS